MPPHGTPDDPSAYLRGEETLREILQPGEKVLWQGKPDRGAYLWRDYATSLFGLFFFGFAIFWTYMVWRGTSSEHGAARLFPLFGVPFLIVGFYLVFGQLIHKALEWPNVDYLVTDRRLVILSGLLRARQRSKFLDSISSLNLKVGRRDGSGGTGTIVVDEDVSPWRGQWSSQFGFTFLGVSGAKEVLALIQQARAQARARPPDDAGAQR